MLFSLYHYNQYIYYHIELISLGAVCKAGYLNIHVRLNCDYYLWYDL